jgi:hypothetical protein
MIHLIFRTAKLATLAMALLVAAAGCGSKDEKPASVAPPEAPAAVAPAPAAAAPAAVVTDVNKSFAQADAALKARNYDQAVQALLAAQRQRQLTDQQAMEARNRMLALQANLASAVASGDANAKAAAERIRQANMVQ